MDEVQSVHLLGNSQALPFQLNAEGLIVTLLTRKPCDHSYVLRITGLDLKASRSAPPPLPVVQAAAVSTMTLLPNSAAPEPFSCRLSTPGSDTVTAKTSAVDINAAFILDAGSAIASQLPVASTGSWDIYQIHTGGKFTIPSEGDYTLTARPADPSTWQALNLAMITLTPTKLP